MSQPITDLLRVPTRSEAGGTERAAASGSGEPFLDESVFQKMLCLERKRSERSRRRFVLMLLEAAPLLKSNDGQEQDRLAKVLHAVSNATRDTDIKGWYKEGSSIGVVFTEIGDADEKAVTDCVSKRMISALSAALDLRDTGVIKLAFHVFPETRGGADPTGPADSPLYPDVARNRKARRASRAVKRVIDIGGSACALLALSPVLLVIAIAIKLTSSGPVLFRQKRVGKHGAPFTFLKFRSMYTGSDDSVHKQYVTSFIAGSADGNHADGGSNLYKLTNDRRVTPVGRFLRRASLDELPQLFNVLAGQMSLVGPRPPILYEYECYDVWHKRRLLTVKPGITGMWQVGGRSRVKFDDMIRMDLRYASTWSVWLDIRILLRTPGAVLSGDGAY